MARAIEGDPAITQGCVCIVANHQVVEDIDVEQAAGVQSLRGRVEIVGRWRRVARRVVVDEDDARGVEAEGVSEQLADTDDRRADGALVGGHDTEDRVIRVEDHDALLFAFQATHLQAGEGSPGEGFGAQKRVATMLVTALL